MHSTRPVNARIGTQSSYPPNPCPGSEKRVLNSHNNQCIVFVKSVPEADLPGLVGRCCGFPISDKQLHPNRNCSQAGFCFAFDIASNKRQSSRDPGPFDSLHLANVHRHDRGLPDLRAPPGVCRRWSRSRMTSGSLVLGRIRQWANSIDRECKTASRLSSGRILADDQLGRRWRSIGPPQTIKGASLIRRWSNNPASCFHNPCFTEPHRSRPSAS